MTTPTFTIPVREIIQATPRSNIVRLDLRGFSFPFSAGQAVLIGRHGQMRRMPYSIACAPEEAERQHWLELLVRSDGDPGTPNPLADLGAGTLVDVEGPTGRLQFPHNPRERRFLFVAGGTGIAPLRSMLWHLLLDTTRARPDSIGMIYSARTPDEFAYADELLALAGAGRLDLKCTVTRAAGDGEWPGERGRIDARQLGAMIVQPETLCVVCGPPDLVRDVPLLLGALGVSPARILIEDWKG